MLRWRGFCHLKVLVVVPWDEKHRSELSNKALPLCKAFQPEIGGVIVLQSNDTVRTGTEIS